MEFTGKLIFIKKSIIYEKRVCEANQKSGKQINIGGIKKISRNVTALLNVMEVV